MNDEAWGFIFWVIFIGVAAFFFLGSEKDGQIEYDDCREVINIEENSWRTWTSDFICDYYDECVHVDTYAFSSKCKRAYSYYRSEEKD